MRDLQTGATGFLRVLAGDRVHVTLATGQGTQLLAVGGVMGATELTRDSLSFEVDGVTLAVRERDLALATLDTDDGAWRVRLDVELDGAQFVMTITDQEDDG